MALINFNGRSYKGKEIKVYLEIDGKQVDFSTDKEINIEITGDSDIIECGSGNINMQGSAHHVKCGSGNVKITGDIKFGDVTTGSGNITIGGNVTGNLKTGSGNIKTGK
jgi:DUF4097 and DUF4098 domain-containing protein YvlB